MLMYNGKVMKQFSAEAHKSAETSGERLVKRVKQIIRDRNNEIAVEVYGSGIGRLDEDSVTQEQLAAETAEVSFRYRDYLLTALADSSVRDEVLAVYDSLVLDDSEQDDLLERISQLILNSTEQAEEVEQHSREVNEEYEIAKAELPGFLDAKILDNRGNRSVMSAWGSAKLAYENGDASSLKTLLNEHVRTLESGTEKDTVERFLRFL